MASEARVQDLLFDIGFFYVVTKSNLNLAPEEITKKFLSEVSLSRYPNISEVPEKLLRHGLNFLRLKEEEKSLWLECIDLECQIYDKEQDQERDWSSKLHLLRTERELNKDEYARAQEQLRVLRGLLGVP